KRGNECFGFLEHCFLLGLPVHPTLGCAAQPRRPHERGMSQSCGQCNLYNGIIKNCPHAIETISKFRKKTARRKQGKNPLYHRRVRAPWQ
ncbi:MAG TPA: hypothetical protein VE176_05930, partial [Candidatus Limnocylindrales bacterium]|nr:hypothetical protein [Candidatus Limnocylindrales bacterium]